ncbi:uncharacterized protein N7496_004505 [Penicillium cataractarum]|uniref:Uncharacterized protein n=1 Tax=Penicillium cataractarum TaxID=2100454 RepID=A0A9W9VHG5_9EURO|nr:uncharacterized protein N7496_004505 [Penicillium cataractarum]KAJ5382077.1 hypothetical protein N7496_004505 [Penicillium cataractarum]
MPEIPSSYTVRRRLHEPPPFARPLWLLPAISSTRTRTTARSYLALNHFTGYILAYQIEDRVLTVTTNNASNNSTLLESV